MSEQRLKGLYQRASAYRETVSGNCTVPPETMIEVLEGRISGAERQRTMLAIMSDPRCRREFELLRALVEHAPEAAEPRLARPVRLATPRRPETPRLVASSMRLATPVRLAASVALLIGAALLWRTLPGRGPDPARDGSSAAVQLIAPTPDALAEPGARFTWHVVPRALRYEYNLVGDGGRVIFSAVQSDTSLVLSDSLTIFPRERLRWWVEAVTSDGVRVRSTLRDLRINAP